MRYYISLLLLLGVSHLAFAFYTPGVHIKNKIAKRLNAFTKNDRNEKVPEKYGPFFYDQPIDHFSLNTSTFKHRYWANTDYYKPGGPVILYNAGEAPADERSFYVINSTMAELAKNLDGIVIVMEHRFYGLSMPAPDFSADSLRTLTTDQALEDIASFIKYLQLPNLSQELPPAPQTKYIVYGGSYSGNLAAWMRLKYPHIVFAAIPSSAPVQMSYNFYKYFDPIRKYGPEHCIHAIHSVILFVDHILYSPFNKDAKVELKKRFGAEDLKHDDDFAELLSYPLGLWQDMTPEKNPFVEEFCTVFDDKITIHEYVEAYSNYTKQILKKACDKDETVNECMDTHDPQSKMYKNVTEPNRAWFWQVCTEYAYWQTGAPLWHSTLVSRKLDTAWYQRQCPLMFGEHNVPRRPTLHDINREYEGWHVSLDRVYWIDGEWDPWRTLSVNSDDAPDHSEGKKDAKYTILPKSVHHWDFFVSNSTSDFIKNTQNEVLAALKTWIKEADIADGKSSYDSSSSPKVSRLKYQHI